MSIFNTGFKLPLAVLDNAAGVAGWVNPENILLVDGDFATSAGPTQIMTVGNFNNNIPQGATILSITPRIKGYRGSFNTTLNLYAVDDTTGVEYSYPYTPVFQSFTGTNTTYTLNPGLFATTWTVNQANNIKFKLIADGELHMDAIEVDISYEYEATPEPATPSDGETVCNEYVQAQPFSLARSFNSSDLYAYLKSFNYPRANGVIDPILIGDFEGEAVLVVDQGKPNEETFLITDVEHNYQGTGQVRLTIGDITNRGLAFKWPYTHDITRCYDHKGTAEVVISNSARFYDRFLKKCHIGALVSAPIEVSQDDVQKTYPTTTLNFKGAGVTVTQNGTDGEQADIDIPGAGITTPVVNDAGSATSGSTQVDTLSVEDLVSSGVNRGLVVQIITQQDVTVTDVTYNGISATQEVVETDVANNIRVEQWFLVAPSVGTYDVVVTLSGVAYIAVGAETLTSVNQSSPIGATDTATGNSNAPTITLVTTTDNSLVFDALGTAVTPIAYVAGAGQSENWHKTSNTDTRQGASSVEAAGTQPDNVVMDWSITQITDWVMTALEVNGIAGTLAGVQSVTGLNTNNTDPFNPVVSISVDGTTITGDGTPGDPLVATGGGGGGSSTIDVYTADDIWTKPSGAKVVEVICIGAGGGGAGGYASIISGAGPATTLGSGGGGGGAVTRMIFDASVLDATEAVTVGVGGTGGTGGTTTGSPTNDAGDPGTDGGSSSFGTFIRAGGGGGGVSSNVGTDTNGGAGGGSFSSASGATAGTPAASAGTDGISGQAVSTPQQSAGKNAEYGGGSGGNQSGGASATAGGSSIFGGAGGGSGGGVQVGGSGANSGGAGGKSGAYTAGGGGAGGGAGANGTNGADEATNEGGYCGSGGGGGGGDEGNGAVGGNGGDGGLGCGGGAGGSAMAGSGGGGTTVTAGNGGAGGDGKVIVITYY